MPRLLIIGGTGEARRLANAVAVIYGQHLNVVTARLGLAAPVGPLAGDIRQGGFGGVDGLVDYFKKKQIDWVIDASHPFATTISRNTRMACARTGRDYLRIERPCWRRPAPPQWQSCQSFENLCTALPEGARRIFLTMGTGGARSLAAAYQCQQQQSGRPKARRHWLIRLACPPSHDDQAIWQAAFGPFLSAMVVRTSQRSINRRGGCAPLVARGPFSFAREIALLRHFKIDCLIAKMSGGLATRAKLAACDYLGIPCLLLARPASLDQPLCGGGDQVSNVSAALDWLAMRHARGQALDEPVSTWDQEVNTALATSR